MTMQLQDSILLIASFAIILAGVTYWLYSHIESQQRKVSLLENVLYELRFAVQARNKVEAEEPTDDAPEMEEEKPEASDTFNAPPPPPEDLDAGIEEAIQEFDDEMPPSEELSNDLQPGGSLVAWDNDESEKTFKNLFVGVPPVSPSSESADSADANHSHLETMALKDLRVLAHSKNISGAKTMKKAELISALRNTVQNFTNQNEITMLEE